jgi:hypothetical protein
VKHGSAARSEIAIARTVGAIAGCRTRDSRCARRWELPRASPPRKIGGDAPEQVTS